MRHVYLVTLFVCVLLVSILGLRGSKFTLPPLDQWPEWAFPSMENQPKLRPQSVNKFFADGRTDANWQSASPGFVGDVTVNGLLAKERTSGSFAYAGTISTNDSTLGAWQKIVDNNAGQAFAKYNQTALVTSRSV